jgi:hypothetical protein
MSARRMNADSPPCGYRFRCNGEKAGITGGASAHHHMGDAFRHRSSWMRTAVGRKLSELDVG